MIKYIHSESVCWWCKKAVPATAEHKYKKTDFVSMFPDYDEDEVVIVNNGGVTPVRGPNSKVLKYSESLCANCNNARSARMDKAYQKFSDYLYGKRYDLIQKGYIDFRVSSEGDWESHKRLVFQYLVKHVAAASIPSHWRYLKSIYCF